MDARSTRIALALCLIAGAVDLVVLDTRIAPRLVAEPTVAGPAATTQLASARIPLPVPENSQPTKPAAPQQEVSDVRVVYFETNGTTLDERAGAVIDEIAAMEAQTGATTEVELDVIGHADPRGGAGYNQSLSERRAAAVSRALIQRGVRVRGTAGMGAALPARPGHDPAALRLNRRVEIRIVRGGT
jgi:OOP family OmpA-OmpF porin